MANIVYPVFFFLFLILPFSISEFKLGLDVSSLITQKNFECLRQYYEFAVVRCYKCFAEIDENAVETVKNAWAANFTDVHVYLFPNWNERNKKNASVQVAEAINNLGQHGANFGLFYIDIEGQDHYWSKNTADNREWLTQLVDAGKSFDKKVGIYASKWSWIPIFGDDYKEFNDLPLWYPHYDGKPSFVDWAPFGGFTQPYSKQYSGTHTICKVPIDRNIAIA